ncbi:MAG: glycosyltransferase family 2 protein [Gammaproteobacteria bacterium]|nr:glycosyltransferase family 2 protein [Gammaproteobacteria bacterium]MBU1446706.1 glycosyltransferase family 2 protein [Gammaproteobacteria bacterium]
MEINSIKDAINATVTEGATPMVSICCITFNHAEYIEHAIEGMLMQETTFPFEILINDDCSTDGTDEVIRAYEKKYPNLIFPVYQKENQFKFGGAINPRFNYLRAKGKYIAICEGDDYWTDSLKLQKQVSFLESNPDYVITYHDAQPFDESGNLDLDFGGLRRDACNIELQTGVPIFTLTTCFRNVFDTLPAEWMVARLGDKFTWSILGSYGKGKYLGDVKPAMYRVHAGGIHSSLHSSKRLEMELITNMSLYSYYNRKKDPILEALFLKRVVVQSIKIFGMVNLIKLMLTFLLKGRFLKSIARK